MLRQEIGSRVSKLPDLRVELAATVAGSWYSKLSHTTATKEISDYCQWTEVLEKELNELKQQLAESNPAEKAKALHKQKLNLTDLRTALAMLADNLSQDNCMKYLAAKDELATKRKAASEDAAKVFASAPLEGVGSMTWILMWEQARAYSENEAYKGTVFPNTGDDARCVLCQQPLEEGARQRFLSFEAYVKGGLESEAAKAGVAVKTIEESLGQIPAAETLTLKMDSAGLADDVQRQGLSRFTQELEKRRATLLLATSLANVAPRPENGGLSFLVAHANSLEVQALEYDKAAKGEDRQPLIQKTRELEARKWLSEQCKAIEAEVSRLTEVQKLEKARELTGTSALSKKKSDLAEELITTAYIQRFVEELHNLEGSQIKLGLQKTRTEKGHVYHQIKLTKPTKTVPTSEVLSEGEIRLVSLAAFLADVRGRETFAPFVFDDPISSLDSDFEEATVKRLVELSKSRQVIVFTHRISLLTLLQDSAEKQDIAAHVVFVRPQPWGIGDPSETPLNVQKPYTAINRLLHERVPKARKALELSGHAEYELLAKGICSDLRILLERLIEFDLLAEVVQRFRRGIQTQNRIHKLARIRLADCKMFDELMSKYSRYEHSQPDEIPVPLPSPDELDTDLKTLSAWHTEFAARPVQ